MSAIKVSNHLIMDRSISPECAFLLIYILSLPEAPIFSSTDLVRELQGQLGREKIRRLIKEAIGAGYVSVDIFYENNLKRISYSVSPVIFYKNEEKV